MGATLNSPSVDARGGGGPPLGDPASILAAALAQRKNKVSASGEFPSFLLRAVCETDCVDDEDEGEDWD